MIIKERVIRTFSISFPLCPRVQAWENFSYFSELYRNLLSFDTRRSLPKTNGLKWAVLRHNILRAREGKGIEELILRVKEAIFFLSGSKLKEPCFENLLPSEIPSFRLI